MLRPRPCFFTSLFALTTLAATGLAACAAIVGFPDRVRGDAGPGNEAGTIDGSAADAGPSPFAQLDAGMGCADYPEAGFCDDFQQGLRTELWTLDDGSGDAGSYTIVQTDPPDGSDDVLELANIDSSAPVTVSLAHTLATTTDPVRRFGFDVFVDTAPRKENVELGRFVEGGNVLVIYFDTGSVSFQDTVPSTYKDNYATSLLPLQRWTRIEVTVSFSTQPATVSATFDGTSVLGSTPLAAGWAPGTPQIFIGYPFVDHGTAKTLAYDNVTVFFAQP